MSGHKWSRGRRGRGGGRCLEWVLARGLARKPFVFIIFQCACSPPPLPPPHLRGRLSIRSPPSRWPLQLLPLLVVVVVVPGTFGLRALCLILNTPHLHKWIIFQPQKNKESEKIKIGKAKSKRSWRRRRRRRRKWETKWKASQEIAEQAKKFQVQSRLKRGRQAEREN